MSSQDGIITLGEAIIYLRMSDFRDEDGMTFTERADQLRDFAAGLVFGTGAAVADCVALVIGDRHAPGRAGAAGRGGGQVAGQVRVSQS